MAARVALGAALGAGVHGVDPGGRSAHRLAVVPHGRASTGRGLVVEVSARFEGRVAIGHAGVLSASVVRRVRSASWAAVAVKLAVRSAKSAPLVARDCIRAPHAA